MTFVDRTTESLPTDFLSPSDTDGNIRHILLGHVIDIRQTIHLLHNLRYVKTGQWSPLIEVPEQRLILRPGPNEMISMLMRQLYASGTTRCSGCDGHPVAANDWQETNGLSPLLPPSPSSLSPPCFSLLPCFPLLNYSILTRVSRSIQHN